MNPVSQLIETFSIGAMADRFSSETELAGFSLLWLFKNRRDLFSDQHIRTLKRVLAMERRLKDHEKFRMIPMRCLLYLESREIADLDECFNMLCHGGRDLRNFTTESMQYIIDEIPLEGTLLARAIELNVTHGHLDLDNQLYLLHCCKGEIEAKRVLLDEWRPLGEPFNWPDKIFQKYLDMLPIKRIQNPMADQVVEMQSYLVNLLLPSTEMPVLICDL